MYERQSLGLEKNVGFENFVNCDEGDDRCRNDPCAMEYSIEYAVQFPYAGNSRQKPKDSKKLWIIGRSAGGQKQQEAAEEAPQEFDPFEDTIFFYHYLKTIAAQKLRNDKKDNC